MISRSKYFVYKNLKLQLLFCNLVFIILIKAITNNIFKNYNFIEKLLKIKLLKNKIYYLRQNKSMLNKLFFYIIFINKIEKVDIFNRYLRKLKVRIKYLRLSIVYNFRAKSLYLVNRIFTIFFLNSISRANIDSR